MHIGVRIERTRIFHPTNFFSEYILKCAISYRCNSRCFSSRKIISRHSVTQAWRYGQSLFLGSTRGDLSGSRLVPGIFNFAVFFYASRLPSFRSLVSTVSAYKGFSRGQSASDAYTQRVKFYVNLIGRSTRAVYLFRRARILSRL